MGELILCKQAIAANPLFIEDASLNVYSLDELSYYIQKNIYLLNADFISVEMCNWIGRELGQKELQKQLLDAMHENAPLHVAIGTLLSHSGYLTNQEIKQVLQTIVTFENKSGIECQKMRADRLMDKNKIVEAIFSYEHILQDPDVKKISREFEGDVWHNLGSAYARLFFFEEASTCFEEAYTRNRKITSLRLMLASLRCSKNEVKFQSLVEKYFVPEDVVKSIKEEVTLLSQQEEIKLFGKQLDELTGTESSLQISEILGQWKKEYNKLCKL